MPSTPIVSPGGPKDPSQIISPQFEFSLREGPCYSPCFLGSFYLYLVTIESSQLRDLTFPPSPKENEMKSAKSYNQLQVPWHLHWISVTCDGGRNIGKRMPI